MSSQFQSYNPTSYLGIKSLNPPSIYFRDKAPDNLVDVNNYNIGDEWLWKATGDAWKLLDLVNLPGGSRIANWVSITGAGISPGIQVLLADNAVQAPPILGICTLSGDAAQGVSTSANAGTGTVETSVQDADTLGNKGVSTYNPTYFNTASGTVSSNLADTSGTLGVSTYTASQFNSVAGLISLTGLNQSIPAFSAYKSATGPGATGNGNVVSYICDIVITNQGSAYNSGTGEFTAPIAGFYAFYTTVVLTGNKPKYAMQCKLVTSNGQYVTVYTLPAVSNGDWSGTCFAFLYMNLGDTVYPEVFATGSVANDSLISGAAASPFQTTFSGVLIC